MSARDTIAELRVLLCKHPEPITYNDLDDGSGYVDEDIQNLVVAGSGALAVLLECADVLQTLVATRAICHRSDFETGNLNRAKVALEALEKIKVPS